MRGAYVSRAAHTRHRVLHYVGGRAKPWLRTLRYVPPPAPADGACAQLRRAPRNRRLKDQAFEDLTRHAFLLSAGLATDGVAGSADAPTPPTPCGRAFRAAAAELATLNRTACCTAVDDPPRGAGGHVRLTVF